MRIRFFQSLFQFVRGQDSSKLKDAQAAKHKSGVGDVPDSFEATPGRGKFFSGKLLTASDFKQEQNYHRDKDKDSDAVVAFQSGDARSPYVLGNLWNTEEKPPVESKDSNDSKDDDN